MNRKEFDKWAINMIKKIDYKEIMTYRLPPADDCDNIVFCYNKKTNKVGIARCHPKDNFNLVWGKAIATARCLGIEVPKITVEKKLSEMKYGEKFKYDYTVYTFLCKIPDSNCYAVKETHSKSRLYNFADKQVEMVE